jgi:hypothetical protein
VWKWEQEGKFDDGRLATIAKLRGVALRNNANRFSGIVAYCYDLGERSDDQRERDRRTRSRWSRKLDKALKKKILPDELLPLLKDL